MAERAGWGIVGRKRKRQPLAAAERELTSHSVLLELEVGTQR